jgi:cellulose synthase (UDP-forming)
MDRIVLGVLVLIGIQAALYYADYWFFGGHRKNIILFIILSYAVFRGVARSVASWVIFLFVSIPKRRTVPESVSVDVLTTAMPGEPYEMFERTLTAMAAMTYPHTRYLLDGGNDSALKKLCARLDIVHIDCSGVGGAKAGKINYCLERYARGEFVLILDPDHIPRPDFIEKALACFTDESIGFVQVVQAYHNTGESVIAKAAAEQTYGFYGPQMMGLNGMGIPVAIGANCLFRRRALDSIGGHAVDLAEDAATSMKLHAQGWQSRYIPYRGSYGLVPADLQTFFKQQVKWSTGMFQLFLRNYFRLFGRFNLAARFYYLFAGTFYLNGIVSLLMILLPSLFLFFKIYAIEMPIDGFLMHLIPYVLAVIGITAFLQRWYTDRQEWGIPWLSMVLEKGCFLIYTLGFVYTLFGKNGLGKVFWTEVKPQKLT